MLRIISVILSCILFVSPLYAQINEKALFNAVDNDDEVTDDELNAVDSDKLQDNTVRPAQNGVSPNLWYIEKALQDTTGIILLEEEQLPPADMPDSVYIRRLIAMPSVISLSYNEIIRNHIVYYMQKYARYTEGLLGRAKYYLPMFEEILDIYNIPLEMRALPVIESALNPVAVSRVGATGMWQFMLTTGRRYGLTVSTYVDERRDPIASTHAAAKYLNDLYSMFQDWTLALAAYNCGEGNVQKAISRSGGKHDYWEIYPYLPRETRNYVPLFVAATYAITYYKEHRLTPAEIIFPVAIDTFMVNTKLHFDQITRAINIPEDELKALNPQYRRNVIPGNERTYELRIPSEYTNAFIEKEKEIYGSDYFNTNIVVTPNQEKERADNRKNKKDRAPANGKQNATTYTVKAGDNLGAIAQKFGVSVNSLREWNKLKANGTIYPGQKLTIYGKNADTKQTASSASKTYKVKKGDSLWSIAQNHNVDIDNLLKANNLQRDSKIQAGQQLTIP